MGIERRRGSRIESSFWITVGEIEQQPSLRRGDVSATGIFFEFDKRIGQTGILLPLRIQSFDRSCQLNIIARFVREVRFDDLLNQDKVAGLGFQFLVEDAVRAQAVEQFVRSVAKLQAEKAHNLLVNYQFLAQVGTENEDFKQAVISTISLEQMVLQTDWQVRIGEPITIEVQAPASKRILRFTGEATECRSDGRSFDGDRFAVKVNFAQAMPNFADERMPISSVGTSIADALGTLINETTLPEPNQGNLVGVKPVEGALGLITVESLLMLFALEERTCRLMLSRDGTRVEVAFLNGRIVDVEDESGGIEPRSTVATIRSWRRGFFRVEPAPAWRGSHDLWVPTLLEDPSCD